MAAIALIGLAIFAANQISNEERSESAIKIRAAVAGMIPATAALHLEFVLAIYA